MWGGVVGPHQSYIGKIMASKVQICNLSLTKVGAGTIISLTDNTDKAKLCNLLFDTIADEVMTDGVYSTTITRATLNKTTNTPVFEFDYEYQLPTSPYCLKVLSLDEAKSGDNTYKIEGDKLLTDLNGVSIKYIGRVTDSELFGPMLTKALVFRLAAELALPTTGSKDMARDMYLLYEKVSREAAAISGQQGSPDTIPFDTLIDVR
jgi:hypothetical protein